METRLRASQHYNRAIVEAGPPLIVIDPHLVITDVNEGMVQLSGFPRKELIGSPLEERFLGPPRSIEAVRELFRSSVNSSLDLVLQPRAGDPVSVLLHGSTFRDPDGDPRGVLALAVR